MSIASNAVTRPLPSEDSELRRPGGPRSRGVLDDGLRAREVLGGRGAKLPVRLGLERPRDDFAKQRAAREGGVGA